MKSLIIIVLLSFSFYTNAAPLKIGTSPLNPPFEILAEAPNHFYGFDIDIMMEICRRIQRECEFVPVRFNNLFAQLNNHQIDLAISAIIITPARRQQFLFSMPYLESNGRFLTLKKSSINAPDDIQLKTVGIRVGSPYKEMAESLYNGRLKVIEYPYTAELLTALSQEDVNAVLMDDEAAKYWVFNTDNTYEVIGTKLPIGDGYGIMAMPNATLLISQINKALLSMEADGKYLEIYSRYFTLP